MGFARINRILPEAAERAGVPEQLIEEASPEAVFLEAAAPLLPEALRGQFRVAGLAPDGTLTVSCRTSAAAYGIRAVQGPLLAKLAQAQPEAPVRRLRVMISTWR